MRHNSYQTTEDGAIFDVSVGDMLVHVISFPITWSWVEFEKNLHDVDRTSESFDITVIRRGDLSVLSTVECHAQNEIVSVAKFSVGESTSKCLIDSNKITGTSRVSISLRNSYQSLVGQRNITVVQLIEEQTSLMSFEFPQYNTRESSNLLSMAVMRYGNVQNSASVRCITEDGTASGTNSEDFISLSSVQKSSVIIFPPGVSNSLCQIRITDDDVYEQPERFYVSLTEPSIGYKLGKNFRTAVEIIGPNDMSILSMKRSFIFIKADIEEIEIPVLRTGKDLNYYCDAYCELVRPDNNNLRVETSHVEFFPGSSSSICKFPSKIFALPGNSEYAVLLFDVRNATVDPSMNKTKLIIPPSSESTSIQFERNAIQVKEPRGILDIPVIRSGNLTIPSSVNCFTRSRTATPGTDYVDRPRIRNSTLHFRPGERKTFCRIHLIDDDSYEPDEHFSVRLGNPHVNTSHKVFLGRHKITRVKIINPEDRPEVSFKENTYQFHPSDDDNTNSLTVELIRKGDLSKISRVRVMSKENTAISGHNFKSLDDIIVFEPKEERYVV